MRALTRGLKAAVPAGKKAVLLCRSGVRSVAAAKRAAELGLEAYNILEGFEGDADEQGQRGRSAAGVSGPAVEAGLKCAKPRKTGGFVPFVTPTCKGMAYGPRKNEVNSSHHGN